MKVSSGGERNSTIIAGTVLSGRRNAPVKQAIVCPDTRLYPGLNRPRLGYTLGILLTILLSTDFTYLNLY